MLPSMPTPSLRVRRQGATFLALGVLGLVAAAGPAAGQAPQVPEPTGTIAFIEDRVRIHTIEADGSADTVIFGLQPDATSGIQAVAWRPDGARLAFASGHEELCSIWVADLYVMDRDGTDLSRLTNGPACGAMVGLPTGSVRVTIANQTTELTDFTIHAQGLEQAVGAAIEPGFQATYELQLHDLGADTPQFIVVRNGDSVWFDAAVYADVQPGATVDAGLLTAGGDPFEAWGALSASWSHDGTRLAYQQGLSSPWQIPASAGPLDIGSPLFAPDVNGTISVTAPVFSPADDRVLYHRYDTEPPTIDVGRADADRTGDAVMAATLVNGLDWLPDGRGFVASDSSALLDSANLVLVDLATGSITPLTSFTGGFAMWPTVSPDGEWVAYSYSPVPLDQAATMELRLHHIASGQERLLAVNGVNADWGP
jgi:hypothetical protein